MHGRSLLAGLALVTAFGCGGGGSDSPTAPSGGGGGSTVTVGNNFFSPVSVSVSKGTTVTWQWAAGDVSHNVTFDDGQNSPTQSSGTYQRMFGTAGTYPYHCTIHGPAMHGTVTVTESSTSGGGGTGGSGMGGGGSGYGP
jgi:plastocyanin